MYEEFYKFKKKPFEINLDPEFYFTTSKYERAIDRLLIAIDEKKCFAVITGETGSGKTMLCQTLLKRLDPATKVTLISNTYLNKKEFFATIFENFNIEYKPRSVAHLLIDFNKYLTKEAKKDNKVVLVIDEAHNLTRPLLDEIWMLSNLRSNGESEKLLQIILIGKPVLRGKMARSKLRQLDPDKVFYYHLEALNRQEAESYIKHRIKKADGDKDIFLGEAINEIYRYSKGIPRLINIACHNILLDGLKSQTKQITYAIANKVMEKLLHIKFGPQPAFYGPQGNVKLDHPVTVGRAMRKLQDTTATKPPPEQPPPQTEVNHEISQEIIDTFFKKHSGDIPKKEGPKARKKNVIFKIAGLLLALAISSIIIILYINRTSPYIAESELNRFRYRENIVKNGRVDRARVSKAYFGGDAKNRSSFSDNKIMLINSGTYGRASLVIEFREYVNVDRNNILILGRSRRGTKKINLILKDSQKRFYEYPGISFSSNWTLKNIFIEKKSNFDPKEIKELKLEFGSYTAGNEDGAVIYIKNISMRRIFK